MAAITYTLMAFWDTLDWTNPTSGADDDITSDVKWWRVRRGKDKELGNVTAGTLEFALKNADKKYTPCYTAGALYGRLRPWIPVTLTADHDGNTYTVYTGYISRISVYPSLSKQEAVIRCTDGMDLLARNMVTLDKDDRTAQNEGTALDALLTQAGWPAALRDLDVDSGDSIDYPAVYEN